MKLTTTKDATTAKDTTQVLLDAIPRDLNFLSNPQLLIFLVLAILMFIIRDNGSKKKKLGRSYWGGKKELRAAKGKAIKQINKVSRNEVGLYLGTPGEIRKKLFKQFRKKGTYNHHNHNGHAKNPTKPIIYLPDVQRGTAVIGGPGTGKTFGAIDPLISSALNQGFPVILYDFKWPNQSQRHIASAIRREYKVDVFAPGMPESGRINIMEFIADDNDAVSARQIAEAFVKNASSSKGGEDDFFGPAGTQLLEGILVLTKWIAKQALEEWQDENGLPARVDDLLMASELLNLDSLVSRLLYAKERNDINHWVIQSLSQIISLADSEKTVASIIGTAQKVFNLFMKRSFVASFCGESTIEPAIDGKRLVVFGLDRNNRDVAGVLVATAIDKFVSSNVSRAKPREHPLVVVIDEIPTINLPRIVNWLNENREDGFCGIIGFQNPNQLIARYGKETTNSIFTGCATKLIFNPQDEEAASAYTKYFGETELRYKTKTRNTGGKNSGGSVNEQVQHVPLIEASELLKFPQGRGIITSPGFSRDRESNIPILHSFSVPPGEIAEWNWGRETWENMSKFFHERAPTIEDKKLRNMTDLRRQIADCYLPLPPNKDSSNDSQ
jgi:type IV secretory pathway TraG/TraD family ATPase VirD4